MKVKAGGRLKSTVCDTEVVAVRAPEGQLDLRCGGVPMIPIDAESVDGSLDAAFSGGTLLGKRYSDDVIGIELLCTRAGAGTLSLGSEVLDVKQAKALPASD